MHFFLLVVAAKIGLGVAVEYEVLVGVCCEEEGVDFFSQRKHSNIDHELIIISGCSNQGVKYRGMYLSQGIAAI